MTPDASKSDNDDVSPAGKVYREMVSDMLAAERDRRTNLEGLPAYFLPAAALCWRWSAG
jgi:hypothetical protein